MGALELAEVTFGRYNNDGRLVESIISRIDIETGELFPEPVELEAGTWLVLWPGGILCTTPLIVKEGRRARFDKLVPT